MNRDDIYVGQILWINHKAAPRELAQVTRVNPKNIKTVAENGTTWTVHPSFLSLADTADVESFRLQAPGEQLTLGAVVRFKEGSVRAASHPQYTNLVVIAHKSAGYWAVAPLGGDQGKHFGKVPASDLVVQRVTAVE